VNRARRENVAVRRGESLRDWRTFFSIYESALVRWGDGASSRYDWSHFSAIRRTAGERAELWIAEREGRPLAGAVNLTSQSVVQGWSSATTRESLEARAMSLLVFEMLRDACRRRFSWFDLSPSGGHEGARTFKRNTGAESIPALVLRQESALTPYVRWVAVHAGGARARAAEKLVRAPRRSIRRAA
jgi:predicted N-acyltransferase